MTVAKINGKQVSLLYALFMQAGLRSTNQQLELIEYDCGFEVKKLEDLNYGQMQVIIEKLKSKYNIEVY